MTRGINVEDDKVRDVVADNKESEWEKKLNEEKTESMTFELWKPFSQMWYFNEGCKDLK